MAARGCVIRIRVKGTMVIYEVVRIIHDVDGVLLHVCISVSGRNCGTTTYSYVKKIDLFTVASFFTDQSLNGIFRANWRVQYARS